MVAVHNPYIEIIICEMDGSLQSRMKFEVTFSTRKITCSVLSQTRMLSPKSKQVNSDGMLH